MREKLARFMAGRNGTDNLARFYSVVALILVLASSIVSRLTGSAVGTLMWFASLAMIGIAYFRMMSRNLAKRRAENEKYLQSTAGIRKSIRAWKERFAQRKDYKFFKCPSCGTMLRVPKNKGRIRVICRKCGNSFEKKT